MRYSRHVIWLKSRAACVAYSRYLSRAHAPGYLAETFPFSVSTEARGRRDLRVRVSEKTASPGYESGPFFQKCRREEASGPCAPFTTGRNPPFFNSNNKCACGKCNANGKSYGTRVYDVSAYHALVDLRAVPATIEAWEDFYAWLEDAGLEPYDIGWGASEDASTCDARALCHQDGLDVLPW
jgi:hypothetical protein